VPDHRWHTRRSRHRGSEEGGTRRAVDDSRLLARNSLRSSRARR
jgi:hypothetical protein